MRFRIKRATNLFKKEAPKPCENAIQDGDKWYVELNTLEDLIKFRDEVSEDLIIEYGWEDNPILIYDTYIE